MTYLVQYSVNYSIYLEADDEQDAIEKAASYPESKWDRSVSQWDADEKGE